MLKVQSGDNHIAFFYANEKIRLDYLVNYFNVGLDNNELCIFVSKQDRPQTISKLEHHGLDVKPYMHSHQFQLFAATSTYLPNGSFSAAYMLANVQGFLQNAEFLGYKGLRTAGEMDWLIGHPETHHEAANYEKAVNNIGGSIPFIGLCLYDTRVMPDQLIQQAIENHPGIAADGLSVRNPHYTPLAV